MEYLDERDINVFTDGSSLPAPRRGGVGIRFITTDADGHEHVEDYPVGGFSGSTNNEMELMACVEVLRAVATRRAPIQDRSYRKLVIWSDSIYLVEGYANALYKWQINGWLTAGGNPVANAAMWRELLKLTGRVHVPPIDFRWVKGHRDSTHNRAADKLAKRSAKGQSGRQASVVKVRRKKTPQSVELGSVPMDGQRITIRIITDQYLAPSKMNRYKYEVVSRRSPYFGRVDMIYSPRELHLSAGHAYYVRLNGNTKAPRIVKIFREVEL